MQDSILDKMPDDIICLIFKATDLDTRYFRICARFAAMRAELVVNYAILDAAAKHPQPRSCQAI